MGYPLRDMIKKFLAKLAGFWDQRDDPHRFHQQEQIIREQADSKVRSAKEWQKEGHEYKQTAKDRIPDEKEILGPSDNNESKNL
jgi:hypothetical protein